MYRCPPFLRYLARYLCLKFAFADHCRAEGIPAVKATTDELNAFAQFQEEETS